MKEKKLIIIGDGDFAENAFEHFTEDSYYEVVAFAVESNFRKKDILLGLPVIDFEAIQNSYSENDYDVFVAVTKTNLNQTRKRLVIRCKDMGYKIASYISSYAFVSSSAQLGENVFVFENATIQRQAVIEDGVIIWCGVTVAHQSKVGSYCWLSPAATVCGCSQIGKNAFVGSNVSIGDYVEIADDIVIGAGSVVVHDLSQKGEVYVGVPARLLGKTSYELFMITPIVDY